MNDLISRQAVLDAIMANCIWENEYNLTSSRIKKAVESLPSTQPRWIPVSERLPSFDDDVLITNGIGMYIGWIDATDKIWRVDSESEYFMNDILALMPLPKPYKAESEEEE